MIYILWLNCIYIYKIKRNFPSAFSFAYRETSKASSLFIFMNEHVKTYIPLCKYTILNMHIHSLVADAKLCFCTVTKPCVSALTKGTVPQGASSVKKLYFWIMWETSHVGRTGQAPSWLRHRGKKQLWPYSHSPANLPGSPAQPAAACLDLPAAAFWFQAQYHSLAHVFPSDEPARALVTVWKSCAKLGWAQKLLHLVCLVCRMNHSKS